MKTKGYTQGLACLCAFALCAALVPVPVLASAPVPAHSAASAGGDAIPDELIVTYKSEHDIGDIVSDAGVGAEASSVLADVGSSDIALVELDESQSGSDAVSRLEADPAVECVEYNRSFHHCTSVNDTYASKSYYLDTEHVKDAWSTSKASGAVAIAVLDTGVTMDTGYRNPEFAGIVDYAHAWDATTGSALSSSYRDYDGHGTAVASIAAAKANNKRGIAGVSYNAKVVPIRVFDDNDECDVSYIVSAYRHILSVASSLNIRVVNMSFGSDADTSALRTLVSQARARGILSVAAAGNYESTWQAQSARRSYPASTAGVVSVAAVNSSRKHASFSYYNNDVDISAAGVGIYSLNEWSATATRVVEMAGRGHRREYLSYTNVSYHPNTYSGLDGTSFSCPVVAGVAALLFAKRPSLTAAQAETALESSARDLGSKGKDVYYGYGEVDATAAVLSVTTPTLKKASRAKKAVKVAWTKLAGVKKYRVYFRKVGAKKWSHVDVKSSKASRKVTGLARKKRYELRIRAATVKSGKTVWTKYSAKRTVRTK